MCYDWLSIKKLLMSDISKSPSQPNPATHIAIAIVLVVAAMTTAAFLATADLVPWTTLIFLAGTVGGVVNNFRRIQKLSSAKLKASTDMAERLVTIQIYVSPFVGGVFAMVLYVIFMAGLVQGSLFPAFSQSAQPSLSLTATADLTTNAAPTFRQPAVQPQPFTTFGDFAANSMPATYADMAKALVWAFIAGFSEGLVPNFISKITKDADLDSEVKDARETDGTE